VRVCYHKQHFVFPRVSIKIRKRLSHTE